MEPSPPVTPEPEALTSSFSRLPREIVQRICHETACLDPLSATCFALSCRQILDIVGLPQGPSYHCPLRGPTVAVLGELFRKPSLRTQFLCRLSRDLEDHVACIFCQRLHPIESLYKYQVEECDMPTRNPSNYGISKSGRPYGLDVLKCGPSRLGGGGFHYGEYGHFMADSFDPAFDFTTFQMAMKRYKQGLPYEHMLQDLISTSFNGQESVVRYHETWARIVAGSLLLRRQVVYVKSASDDTSFEDMPRLCHAVCVHFACLETKFKRDWVVNPFNVALKTALSQWEKCNEGGGQSGMLLPNACKYCETEYFIDFKKTENRVAMYITVWKDLGSGSEDDQKWIGHIPGLPKSPTPATPQNPIKTTFLLSPKPLLSIDHSPYFSWIEITPESRRNIHVSFEGKDNFAFDDLVEMPKLRL